MFLFNTLNFLFFVLLFKMLVAKMRNWNYKK